MRRILVLMAFAAIGLAPMPATAGSPHHCFGEVPTVVGTHGDNSLSGDVVVGRGGTDAISGRLVCGNSGDDYGLVGYMVNGDLDTTGACLSRARSALEVPATTTCATAHMTAKPSMEGMGTTRWTCKMILVRAQKVCTSSRMSFTVEPEMTDPPQPPCFKIRVSTVRKGTIS